MRSTTVLVSAMAVAGLALIGLLMGVFAAMPAGAGVSCGHLFDPANQHSRLAPACSSALHQRRIEVTTAAVIGGAAGAVGLAAYTRVMRERLPRSLRT